MPMFLSWAPARSVGQTLSIDLAKPGVSVMLIERNETCLQHPKMERRNARTMEFYRRLGTHEHETRMGHAREEDNDGPG
jgi:2-polyprenyl-6-methoxyphenol hydroxylase-like FAD-dependent oxidoreductase